MGSTTPPDDHETLATVAEIIFETADAQGQPLSRDVCALIALKLKLARDPSPRPVNPGDIARYHRERYDGNPPSD